MAHPHARTRNRICDHPTCRGPPGSFSASVYFQVAVNEASTPVFVSASSIPFDLVLANVGGGLFDTVLHQYVAPLGGPYAFVYTVALSDTGAGTTANGNVVVYAEVGSLQSPQTVQRLSLQASFSKQPETRTLSGSAIIELLPLQTLRLTVVNLSGNSSSSIIGPVTTSTPPYPTLLSAYSLF